MPYTDKTIVCADCGSEFVFSVGEQERYAQLGFTNEPKRCSPCRAAKKARTTDGPRERVSAGRPRELFAAVCSECGVQTQVPFRPRGDRPVYCSDCFSRRR